MLCKKAVYNGLSLELYIPLGFQRRTYQYLFKNSGASSVG